MGRFGAGILAPGAVATGILWPQSAPRPQVDRDFEGALTEAAALDRAGEGEGVEALGKRGVKRQRTESVAHERVCVAARQRAWLRRARSGAGAAAWRPKKVPRKASFRWIVVVDAQIRQTTWLPGLSYFIRPDPGTEQHRMPLSWPVLSISLDRGSEGVAAVHYLQREKKLVLDEAWDPLHDSWRDYQRVLRECSLLAYWYLYMVAANVLHGPFLESARYKALVEALREAGAHFTADTCPLYDEVLRDILKESGRPQDISDESRAEVWQDLLEEPALLQKRYKINMNRFWHGVQTGWVYARHFSQFKFAITYLGLETGALSETNVNHLLFKQNDHGGKTTTQGEATSMEERALKSKGVSAISLAVLYFSDASHLMKLRCLLIVAQPVEDWYRDCSFRCRTIDGNYQWFLGQLAGQFMEHIVQVWKRSCLSSLGVGQRVGAPSSALRARITLHPTVSDVMPLSCLCGGPLGPPVEGASPAKQFTRVFMSSLGRRSVVGPTTQRLWRNSSIEWVGLWVPGLGESIPTDEALMSEEEAATTMARVTLAMVAARAARAVSLLRSWPHRALVIAEGGEKAEMTILRLRKDYELFCKVEQHANAGNQRAKLLAKRSVFHLAAVQQVVLALQNGGTGGAWSATEEFCSWLRMKAHRIQTSLLCEVAFNCQKNNNVVKSKRRYMTPSKASMVVLNSQARIVVVVWGVR